MWWNFFCTLGCYVLRRRTVPLSYTCLSAEVASTQDVSLTRKSYSWLRATPLSHPMVIQSPHALLHFPANSVTSNDTDLTQSYILSCCSLEQCSEKIFSQSFVLGLQLCSKVFSGTRSSCFRGIIVSKMKFQIFTVCKKLRVNRYSLCFLVVV